MMTLTGKILSTIEVIESVEEVKFKGETQEDAIDFIRTHTQHLNSHSAHRIQSGKKSIEGVVLL